MPPSPEVRELETTSWRIVTQKHHSTHRDMGFLNYSRNFDFAQTWGFGGQKQRNRGFFRFMAATFFN